LIPGAIQFNENKLKKEFIFTQKVVFKTIMVFTNGLQLESE
jgi:hypothetical protein